MNLIPPLDQALFALLNWAKPAQDDFLAKLDGKQPVTVTRNMSMDQWRDQLKGAIEAADRARGIDLAVEALERQIAEAARQTLRRLEANGFTTSGFWGPLRNALATYDGDRNPKPVVIAARQAWAKLVAQNGGKFEAKPEDSVAVLQASLSALAETERAAVLLRRGTAEAEAAAEADLSPS